ncbi:Hypothetical_protein [Hexamita inflata]|uniref:Hypothetical_protein n=1 Tax=Hexamita inflata TaxID=28002 RepID=A0AA86QLT7_9EUKA|nr:Hypothetical protein HINF_LOCUS46542 [Hexamita inflata]
MSDELCYQEESLCLSRCGKSYCINHNTTFCCSNYNPDWKYWAWGIFAAVFGIYIISYFAWRIYQEKKLSSYQKLSKELTINQDTKQIETVVQHSVPIQEQIVIV